MRFICAILAFSLGLPSKDLPNGLLWSKPAGTRDMDENGHIAVDSRGNIYVACHATVLLKDSEAGSGPPQIRILKYDRSGRELWEKAFTADGYAYLGDVAVDAEGNVIVLVEYHARFEGVRSEGESDIALLKLDSNGRRIWSRSFGTKDSEIGRFLGIGAQGAIYATASTNGAWEGQAASGYYRIVLVKYGPDGKQVWSRLFGTAANNNLGGITLDSLENIYLAESFSAAAKRDTLAPSIGLLVKLDSSGAKKWEVRFDVDSSTFLGAVSADRRGSILVAGATSNPPNQSSHAELSGSSYRTFLTKLDNEGSRRWTSQVGFGVQPYRLASDPAGNAYLFAGISDTLTRRSTVGLRFGLLKFDTDGNRKWIRIWGEGSFAWDPDMTLDKEGFLYMIGAPHGGFGVGKVYGDPDLCMMKASPVPPSFDCTKAVTLQEKLICSDLTLSGLDDSISTLYSFLRKSSADSERVRSEQVAWLKKRNGCKTSQQLLETMRERNWELKAFSNETR